MFQIIPIASRQKLGLYRLLSVVICLALILGAPAASFAAPEEKNDTTPLTIYTDPYGYPSRSAIVHLFEWKWTDIAKECTNVLGPKGYKAVQVSPPSEHAVLTGVPLYYDDGDNDASNDVPTGRTYDYPWWQRYQTVGLAVTGAKFTSRSGNLTDFTAMISACHTAGVEVYVDAIVNHSTNQDNGGVGSAGTSYSHYDTDDYSPQDYHQGYYDHCPNWDIPGEAYGNTDWGDEAVRICELNNLADLVTSDAIYVQPHIRQYLNSLISIGVDGFRIDAAKHMYPSDIQAIIGGLNNTTLKNAKPYLYLEVIGGDAAVNIYDYVPVTTDPDGINYSGDLNVTEFVYGKKLSEKFKSGLLADLGTFGYTADRWGMIPDQDAQIFVNNHDNQRGHGGSPASITYKDGQTFALLNVFMLAWPFGDPSVMSSYEFDIVGTDNVKYDGLGPPSTSSEQTESIYITATTNRCALGPTATTGVQYYDSADNRNGWVCEHSWKAVANMAGFRAWAVQTADANTIHNWWDNNGNQIAFGVNNKGFVIINKEVSGLSNTTLGTGLPDGTYCNVILGELNAQKTGCTSETVTVTGGAASFTVPANSAVAIHIGQKVQPAANPAPTISVISPGKVTAGGPQFTLTVTGTNFVTGTNGSVIKWNGSTLSTTRISATQLTAPIAATLFSTGTSASITVVNPDGQVSNAQPFTTLATPTFIYTNDGIKATGGDNTGYEKNATGTSSTGLNGNFVLSDNAKYGQDVKSGTATSSISCAGSYSASNYSTRDQHDFYFNLTSLPDNASITAIQVQVEAAKSSTSYDGRICAYLSPNAAASWSTWDTSWASNLTTTSTKYTFPNTAASTWNLSNLTGASLKPTKNFVLRLVDITNTATGQTFKVDFVAVKLFYTIP